jgi:predicted Rossmann fold flavoprotein
MGGKTAKQFGTDGTAYALVEKFGHTVTELYPSLVQLKCELGLIRGLKGLKETARVTAISSGKELKSAIGDVLFTEYGISGNAVFQISRHLTNVENPSVRIEFLPDMDIDKITQILIDREKVGLFKRENKLLGLINKRIGQAVIKTAKSTKAKDVTFAIKNFDLNVTGNLGFNYAQVTKGGVNANQVNPYTLESLKRKGVYIIGEALDVDGDCGGYNLAFAFESGIICAQDIKEKVGKEN